MQYLASFFNRRLIILSLFVVCCIVIAVVVFTPAANEPPAPGAPPAHNATTTLATPGTLNQTEHITVSFKGEPFLFDDFSSREDSLLDVGQNTVSRYSFKDGEYLMTGKTAGLLIWSMLEGDYGHERDLAVEVEATMRESNIAAGIIFRYQNESNFYLFNIANNGFYDLELVQDGVWTSLIDWTPTPAMVAQPEQASEPTTNTLRVELRGPEIALFVNNTWLETTIDSTFAHGNIALVVNTFDEEDVTIRFDNLAVWRSDAQDRRTGGPPDAE